MTMPEDGASTHGAQRGHDTPAGRAWRAMRLLVLERADRRRAVCDALDMSFIRVKALRRVTAAPSTLRELATGLAIDPPYTTVIIDDLESRGLVVRTPHPSDRRAKVVTVTAAGRLLAERAQVILDQPPALLTDLPADDLAALNRILSPFLDG